MKIEDLYEACEERDRSLSEEEKAALKYVLRDIYSMSYSDLTDLAIKIVEDDITRAIWVNESIHLVFIEPDEIELSHGDLIVGDDLIDVEEDTIFVTTDKIYDCRYEYTMHDRDGNANLTFSIRKEINVDPNAPVVADNIKFNVSVETYVDGQDKMVYLALNGDIGEKYRYDSIEHLRQLIDDFVAKQLENNE